MKKIALVFSALFIFFVNLANSQEINNLAYGDTLMNNGDVREAIIEYQKAYYKTPKNPETSYNLACAFSLNRQTDSAIKYLYVNIALDTTVYPLTNPDFLQARENKGWNEFEDKLIQGLMKKLNNPYKDIEYAKKLWKMRTLDQAYYSDMEIVKNKIGVNSTVMKALFDLKDRINKNNVKELEELIESKGWPRKSQVGESASSSAFLIIQHSTLELRKKYLPIIKQLCEENEAEWSEYAMMYDRVQTFENKPQRYGTQIRYNEDTKSFELLPLEDESKVNEWRKEVGLGNIEGYLVNYGIVFKPKKSN
jgi:hypothetical protein